jgi:hypothetical protein
MSNKQTDKTFPAYRVYSVSRNGDKKAVWQEIGAAWKHKDGKGFNLQFNALPLEGAQIVLREPSAKKTGVKASGQALGRYDELNANA